MWARNSNSSFGGVYHPHPGSYERCHKRSDQRDLQHGNEPVYYREFELYGNGSWWSGCSWNRDVFGDDGDIYASDRAGILLGLHGYSYECREEPWRRTVGCELRMDLHDDYANAIRYCDGALEWRNRCAGEPDRKRHIQRSDEWIDDWERDFPADGPWWIGSGGNSELFRIGRYVHANF